MGTRLTSKDSAYVRGLEKQELLEFCAAQDLQVTGANYRFFLSEIAIRLDTDEEDMAIIMSRKVKDVTTLYHWGWYQEDRAETLKNHPLRKWNNTVKANTFICESQDDVDQFIAFNNALFGKTLLVPSSGPFDILDGQSAPVEYEGHYDLMDDSKAVSFSQIVQAFMTMRPTDTPQKITLHSEIDSDHRSEFGGVISVADLETNDIAFQTRHPDLLFRISLDSGRPRYMSYSVADGRPIEIGFHDSKESKRMMSELKQTQRKLQHPVFETKQPSAPNQSLKT